MPKQRGLESEEEKINPFRDAHLNLAKAAFATENRNEFFDEAVSDILAGFFKQWLLSEPHETKTREYLYHCAMALGSIKEQLARYETLGKNTAAIQAAKQTDQDEDPNEEYQ